MSAKYSESITYKKGIFIDALDDIKMLAKIARYGKWIPGWGYIFMAGLGTDEVYDTYKDGGDVFKKAVGVIFEIGVIQGLTKILLLDTPAGWVILVGTVVAEGFLLTGVGNFAEHIGEKIADSLEEGDEWLKKHLSYWL